MGFLRALAPVASLGLDACVELDTCPVRDARLELVASLVLDASRERVACLELVASF